MKELFYTIWQSIQSLFLFMVLLIGIIIAWLKGDIKFDE